MSGDRDGGGLAPAEVVVDVADEAVDAVVGEGHRDLKFSDLETGLSLIGMTGMIDPPREDAILAVHQCRSAGIQVKMITGDHAVTAVAIGAQMGIGDGEKVITGQDMEAMDESALRTVVDEVDVFARSSPEHKLRLVSAMQANGQVVAMTGDGINDAPALKQADIGEHIIQLKIIEPGCNLGIIQRGDCFRRNCLIAGSPVIKMNLCLLAIVNAEK